MTVLTMRAAEVGWSLFASSDPPPTLDELNEELEHRSLPNVSGRMYDHYRRLMRHGHEHYIPINELDMAIKAKRRQRREGAR